MNQKCSHTMMNGKPCSRNATISGFLIPYVIGYNKCGFCQQHFKVLSKTTDNRKNADNLFTMIPRDCLNLILPQIGFKDQWSLLVSSFRMNGIMREWVYTTPLIRKFNFQKKYEALYQKQLEDYAKTHNYAKVIRVRGVDSDKLNIDSYSKSSNVEPRIIHYLVSSWDYPMRLEDYHCDDILVNHYMS